MLAMLPLLVSDPSLPEELRRTLASKPEDGVPELVKLGVSCHDAVELVGVAPDTTVCACLM